MGREWVDARSLAFATLIEHLPTDQLHSKIAATVFVTMDLDQLFMVVSARDARAWLAWGR